MTHPRRASWRICSIWSRPAVPGKGLHTSERSARCYFNMANLNRVHTSRLGCVKKDRCKKQPPQYGSRMLFLSIDIPMRSAGRHFAVISAKMIASEWVRSDSKQTSAIRMLKISLLDAAMSSVLSSCGSDPCCAEPDILLYSFICRDTCEDTLCSCFITRLAMVCPAESEWI